MLVVAGGLGHQIVGVSRREDVVEDRSRAALAVGHLGGILGHQDFGAGLGSAGALEGGLLGNLDLGVLEEDGDRVALGLVVDEELDAAVGSLAGVGGVGAVLKDAALDLAGDLQGLAGVVGDIALLAVLHPGSVHQLDGGRHRRDVAPAVSPVAPIVLAEVLVLRSRVVGVLGGGHHKAHDTHVGGHLVVIRDLGAQRLAAALGEALIAPIHRTRIVECLGHVFFGGDGVGVAVLVGTP